MSTLRITFTATDHEKLDRAVTKVMHALPTDQYGSAEVSIGTRQGEQQSRLILLNDPTDTTVGSLVRIDIPHTVSISITEI